MKKRILNLLNDDYYSLWEIRDVISRVSSEYCYKRIKTATIDLVREGRVLCYVSPDLGIDSLDLVTGSESLDLLEVEENWLVPSKENAQIVRLTLADNPK